MKQIELNVFPVYTTEAVLRLVVPSGLFSIKSTKSGAVVLKCPHKEAFNIVMKYLSEYTEVHESYFNELEVVFSKEHSYRLEEVCDGTMVRFTVYHEVFKKYDYDTIDNDTILPFALPYVYKEVDNMKFYK